ncbi:MAG: molybdopterin-dependent oxidoreductase, partial [Anaerolineae bacterium]|nr:molybdopterin-dependent oxidoreductase [Anaerolineae bacterium]
MLLEGMMADSQIFNLTVNDKPRTVACSPQKNLMDVIRDDLRLTGTKDGCSTGHCGSCMVIQDGKAIRACLVPMKRAEGAHVTTIEGVCGADGGLHPIQQAYIDQGATQCGICTPGFVMATKALLDKNPNPTLEEIYDGHVFNICRCTGYNAIIRAIQQSAGQAVTPLPEVKRPMSAISQPKPRPDAVAKVKGTGIYADDIYIEGMLHAKALRSKYPHALIKSIEASAAKGLAGVVAVLTHDDVPGRKDSGVHEVDWPVLCYDKVRYVGDALALVVAESEEIAEEALKLIAVEYEVLPVVTDPKRAAQPDAPILHEHNAPSAHGPGGNFKAEYHLDNGDVEKGFAESDVVIEREYSTQFVEHGFIEPEAGVAVPGPDGRITVYCGGQIPFGDRAQIAATLDVPESMIRVVNCLIGGGFGGKEDVSVQVLVALAAQRYRPPKAHGTRQYAVSTLERWYYAYQKGGLASLRPERRSDAGR